MKLVQIEIKNFRLLRSVSIGLDAASLSTILVGPNNSGKTSVAEILQLFTSADRRLSISDFSLACRSSFARAEKLALDRSAPDADIPPAGAAAPQAGDGEPGSAADGASETARLAKLPAISLVLDFTYEDVPADLVAVTDLLMDLDPARNRIAIEVEFAPKNPATLLASFRRDRQEGESLVDFLRTRLHDFYGFSYFKLEPESRTREPLPNATALDRLFRVDFVAAQRHIDDQELSKATRLSALIHKHYDRRQRSAGEHDVAELARTLGVHSTNLTEVYKTTFAGLVNDLGRFGYPQNRSPRLSIRAELSADTLLKESTRLYYAAEEDAEGDGAEPGVFELPEKYNGLGFKNLIYMVLQITAFREEIRASDVRPRVHLIVIEEPEVHLHPQVQSVFIKRITEFIRGDGGGVDAQVMLTTHSPHIVADSGFAPVRYFRRRGNTIRVRDLLTFKAEREKANDSESVRFLTQYLTQTRCDILFADKAILIEGQVERLLLPIMMGKCATGPAVTLLSEYVSVIEIGGAHAHLFRALLEFLEVPTLIVTDLDSVGPDKKRCRVAEGESTSNQTLKTWLPGKADLAVLHAATAVEKTKGRIQVAYQVPERDGLACGRTFEEAFVYCNAAWLLANQEALSATGVRFDHASATALSEQAFDLTLDKVDFALDLMTVDGWTTPKYIADGLRWLAEQAP